jgi:hypothetical protein
MFFDIFHAWLAIRIICFQANYIANTLPWSVGIIIILYSNK